MGPFSLSRRKRRSVRRTLAGLAWVATLVATFAGMNLLVKWDEGRSVPTYAHVAEPLAEASVQPPEPVLPSAAPWNAPSEPAEAPVDPRAPAASPRGRGGNSKSHQDFRGTVVTGNLPEQEVGIDPAASEQAPSEEAGPASVREQAEHDEELSAAAVVPDLLPSLPPQSAMPGQATHLSPEQLPEPSIAIVIDDLGYDDQAVARLIALGLPMTLSFLPFGTSLNPARTAAADGLQIIVHMPMEPIGNENPGPGAIMVGMPADAIKELVSRALARVPQAAGMNNHMGSKATADAKTIAPVMARLAGKGLFFLDSRTSGKSQARAQALLSGVPAIGRDIFLDNDPSVAAVTAQLQAAEQLARRRGYAVAIGHPHAGTMLALQRWLPAAVERGVRFTTLSRLAAIDTCRHPTPLIVCTFPPDEGRLARTEVH